MSVVSRVINSLLSRADLDEYEREYLRFLQASHKNNFVKLDFSQDITSFDGNVEYDNATGNIVVKRNRYSKMYYTPALQHRAIIAKCVDSKSWNGLTGHNRYLINLVRIKNVNYVFYVSRPLWAGSISDNLYAFDDNWDLIGEQWSVIRDQIKSETGATNVNLAYVEKIELNNNIYLAFAYSATNSTNVWGNVRLYPTDINGIVDVGTVAYVLLNEPYNITSIIGTDQINPVFMQFDKSNQRIWVLSRDNSTYELSAFDYDSTSDTFNFANFSYDMNNIPSFSTQYLGITQEGNIVIYTNDALNIYEPIFGAKVSESDLKLITVESMPYFWTATGSNLYETKIKSFFYAPLNKSYQIIYYQNKAAIFDEATRKFIGIFKAPALVDCKDVLTKYDIIEVYNDKFIAMEVVDALNPNKEMVAEGLISNLFMEVSVNLEKSFGYNLVVKDIFVETVGNAPEIYYSIDGTNWYPRERLQKEEIITSYIKIKLVFPTKDENDVFINSEETYIKNVYILVEPPF